MAILYLTIIALTVALWSAFHKPTIISPLPDPVYSWFEPTPSPTSTPAPTKENIVAYIMKVFEPEGTHIAVRAIRCFYSESGLRTDAYNFNSNGTEDRGVAQVNSIHGLAPDDAHNFQKNIDKAYQIYKSRGNFSAWYGADCN